MSDTNQVLTCSGHQAAGGSGSGGRLHAGHHMNGSSPPQRAHSAVPIVSDMEASGVAQGDERDDDDQPLLRTTYDAR